MNSHVLFVLRVGLVFSNLFMLSACSSWQKPDEFDDEALRARTVTAKIEGVTLSTAVLSVSENQRLFGVEIDPGEVQPVWIEVHNETDHTLYLLRSGTDPDLYSPLEVAWSFHRALSTRVNAEIDSYFRSLSFHNPIAPGETKTGVIYANPHSQVRLLNVDILGQGKVFPFTLYPKIPGEQPKQSASDLLNRIEHQVGTNYSSMETLHKRLEHLPCCTSVAS